jgi:hypothetical protein
MWLERFKWWFFTKLLKLEKIFWPILTNIFSFEKIFRRLFPKKLNFEEEFLQDPVSKNTQTAFSGLTNHQVREYFNYSEPQWGQKILLAVLSEPNSNDFTLEEVLESLITRVEEDYIKRGEVTLQSYFQRQMEDEKVKVQFIRLFTWNTTVHTVLVNLEKTYVYLDRKPIPELLEDISVHVRSAEIQHDRYLEEQSKLAEEQSKLDKERTLDFEQKQKFLVKLINELEVQKVDRLKIKQLVVHKFFKTFSVEVSYMMRIHGNWTVKFNHLGTTQTVTIIPH